MNEPANFTLLGTNPAGLVRLEAIFEDGTTRELEIPADDLLDPDLKRLQAALGVYVPYEAFITLNDGILPFLPRRLFRSFRADTLNEMEFPPVTWIVPQILPEGLAVLAGKPKVGKSWWAMGKAIEVARTGSVLYCALEDPPRRLQQRMRPLLGDGPAPKSLEFRTEWPRLDQGGLEALSEWLEAHPIAKLIVIDTIAKVRPPRAKGEDQYLGDYGVWGALQALLLAHPGVAILGVHHQRKGAADDILDTILGSQGVGGTVDTAIVLQKARGTADGELFVTGRDIEQEQERALRFEGGRWTDIGPAADARQSGERAELVTLLAVDGPSTISEIARALGIQYDNARMRLTRAAEAGSVKKLDGGKWSVP